MISVIAIGKNKDKALRSLEEEYTKRLSAFNKIEVIEVKDEPNDHVEREKEMELIKQKEGDRVLAKIKDNDFVVLLDLHGQMLDSESFAKKIDAWQSKHLVFVIAGSLGPSVELVKRANYRWKLSDLTFTHLMTRVLILEQIYRGYMINNNRNYHK
ncbi:MAG: 23S rRNA (pseudouridine(1915)-N(3))-methyltransferase RlmH [Firmicutes bacterium]|nr:23S rRNA (pseudouridine(1915)-N(3))-methyltransferase RlmH [Bacillota bacterium]